MSGSTAFDFVAISVPSTDADSLASQLTERSAQGWDVVSIVGTDAGLVAFCRRVAGDSTGEATGESTGESTGAGATTTDGAGWAARTTEAPLSEPHGHATHSATTYGTAEHATSPVGAPSPAASAAGEPAVAEPAPAQPAVAQPAVAQPAGTPQVPAGWYSDPSGRFELRYWDGNAWTEHVARNGQQYTDAPVP